METSISPRSEKGTVCVVGLGYIGLPTAAFIASAGYTVVGVDTNHEHVKKINEGTAPFFEPDFGQLLEKVVENGTLRATAVPEEASAFIIAVPTPLLENREVDTSYIRSAAQSISGVIKPGDLVILESTSPPGTTVTMANYLMSMRPDLSLDEAEENAIFVAHCPERVLPGRIMVEMTENNRVIGGLNSKSSDLARGLYASFCKGELLVTDATTAEMVKLTENSFRDVNIAFANELSVVCDRLGIDVWELIELANHHPRVNILQPGPGVGGHCIAVDPWFIVSAASGEAKLIRTAREVNDTKPSYVLEKVSLAITELHKPVVAVFGITFKADVDDLRESPSLAIAAELASAHPSLTLLVVEPNIQSLPAELSNFSNTILVDMNEALLRSDIAVLLVDHRPFKTLAKNQLVGKTVIDTKGIWS